MKNLSWKWPVAGKDVDMHGNKHLLVVDDDPAMRTILCSILASNFHTTAVGSGYEALAWLADGNLPDLIVSDISMPGINGFGLLKALSQSGLYNTIPVVVLSAHCKDEIREHTTTYDNLKAYLSKPFDPVSLKEQISTILDAELQLC